MQGRITKQISNLYTVITDDKIVECSARGKFRNNGISPVVGDIVDINIDTKTIEEILPRKNILNRPIVANIDIALIVTSVKKPDLSLILLDKLLVNVLANNIKPVICLTKLDLINKQELKELKTIINYYKSIGVPVISNKQKFKLKRTLKNNLVVLTGQSGAGKSSLLNRLNKDLNLKTSEVSDALNRGVHTTRHTEIYQFDKIYFVDTPGFSALDLTDVTVDQLKKVFLEFDNYHCSFSDCTHNNEKNCGVKEAIKNGKILSSRYENYIRFLKEIHESSSKLYK